MARWEHHVTAQHHQTGLPAPTRTLKLSGSDPQQKRLQLLRYFRQTWELYESLFDCLSDERAWYNKAISLRHPPIFYYGHTATFFINKLMAGGLIDARIDDRIEATMAIGVDEMSWDDLDNSHYSWPSLAELRDYRGKVRHLIEQFIQQMPLTLPIDWNSPAWVILMGIEHERIHLETSSVLIRQLPLAWVKAQPHWPACPEARHDRQAVPHNSLVSVSAGRITLGKTDDTYGWDNEYGSQVTEVKPFQASRMLVSNAEFFAFVAAGGYQTRRWWDDEGWGWREFAGAHMPTFWAGSSQQPEALRLRLLAEEVPMPWDWPAEVNQLEAAAFCRWKAEETGLAVQLPAESEWMRLREQVAGDQPDWSEAPGNINLARWASSCPVDRFAHGEFYDLVGNVWQWTTTPISGFPGFRVHPLYDDFSTPTFDGKHTLIKGGSWISTGNEALKSARYAFRRHFFQHAGFRYVVSQHQGSLHANPYETDSMVSQYLDFQYGAEYFGVGNYAKTLAQIAGDISQQHLRALDIGCATGRASFELARHFKQVVGMDYSARFIDVALQLSRGEGFRYVTQEEGDLIEYHQLRLQDYDLGPEQASRIRFVQGDACNLKPQAEAWDLVLAANLIDRLRQPKRFLTDITPTIRPGGVLMLSSPYTWLEAFTPKESWLGGMRENGEALSTYQALQRLLAADFEEIAPPQDVPFVIRETARKFQHSVAQLTLWRKR
ncbi:5-histidylcysteine sulfoxide synthase [Erwinia amylovora]|uniref:Meiotically up-regulated gene 158 protein n=3 Tax=Erwinia amylovora TaxID=552 RepID=A0A831A247_ERWAM|nr:5-histidylcysteine sulfoxide synthase [Erwinia amylovora]EKV55783.1 Meiotically up-regulated gene 158 protein [Erwinia amylovora ACW56400]MCK8156819.1 5-histidylcysteine sulfoxide synthase [Erwinia amylovora]MCK8160219.1 5-histidylcysteine sulfoxide synthase [Erwinia amylovora]MCK8163551.1 5-histidylcysteine sulfoxide synthase [Erwinia amylovora]MCK8167008.1 5-histidylcysteine sulfoxide synthase [Erwinia amylovora]